MAAMLVFIIKDVKVRNEPSKDMNPNSSFGGWGNGYGYAFGVWGLGFRVYRGTSLMRKRPPPRTTIGPWAWAYCRVLGGCVFMRARCPCTQTQRARQASQA